MSVFCFTIVEMSGKNDIQMIEYSNADMKGYIPSSLLNLTLGWIWQVDMTDMAVLLNNMTKDRSVGQGTKIISRLPKLKRNLSQDFQKHMFIKEHGLFGSDDCKQESINFEMDQRLADYKIMPDQYSINKLEIAYE